MKSTRQFLMLGLIALLSFSCTKGKLISEDGNLVPKTVIQDPNLPSITVNGARLHSEAFGPEDSTMIICLHGGPGNDYRNLLNCKELANYGYRVVFYDQRGSGLSERFSKASYTNLGIEALDLMYNELGGVIQHYRTSPTQKVILLGHSWGGILATGYVAKHPKEIQGLVVCEPGGLKWEDIKTYNENSRTFNLLEELFNDAMYSDQFITGDEDQHAILDYKLGLVAIKNNITGEFNLEPGSFWRHGAVILDGLLEVGKKYNPDFSEGLNNFKVPVLFFYSEQNQAYSTSWAEKISKTYKSVNLFKVTDTGHYGIISDEKAWTTITLPKTLNYLQSL